jgi:hypothetical protein
MHTDLAHYLIVGEHLSAESLRAIRESENTRRRCHYHEFGGSELQSPKSSLGCCTFPRSEDTLRVFMAGKNNEKEATAYGLLAS